MDTSLPSPSTTLVPFSLIVLASVAWVAILILLIPRLLGRLLSFITNRWSRNTHIKISTLYLYPLSGRAVAHTIHYTLPDAAISVEELVLQVRWWRPSHDTPPIPLTPLDPHTLDPVAARAEEAQRAHDAPIHARLLYYIRRWWHRTAISSDPKHPTHPPPLVSLVLAGLRVRVVNVQRNHNHLRRLINHANGAEISLYSPRVQRVEKSFWHRLFELASLRITGAAVYFCDMGQSPLARLMLTSAKLRYTYGPPGNPDDVCRKRLRLAISGLKLSVASKQAIMDITKEVDDDVHFPPLPDNTDRFTHHIVRHGHQGFADSSWKKNSFKSASPSPQKDSRVRRALDSTRRHASSLRHKLREIREVQKTRRKTTLPCSDILNAATAVIDYVFDEPGPIRAKDQCCSEKPLDDSAETSKVDSGDVEAGKGHPVNRATILLRGCAFSYDIGAIADIERIMERLQPSVYDLMSFATQLNSQNTLRSPTGMQVEIDATASLDVGVTGHDEHSTPIISIPFDPQTETWKGLVALGVRQWHGEDKKSAGNKLPSSFVNIHGSNVSIRTEIPYSSGAQQNTVITVTGARIDATGIVDMPLCKAESITYLRSVKFPQVWNEVHSVIYDVLLEGAEIMYLPDMMRIIEDIGATMTEKCKKPRDVRYFVPFKETTKIRADNGYCVFLSCSRDNAWENIHEGVSDEFGKMKLHGDKCELVITPSEPTEYKADAYAYTWALSLPNVKGSIVLDLPMDITTVGQKLDETLDRFRVPGRRTSEFERSAQKIRTSIIGRRVKSQLETRGSSSHGDHLVHEKEERNVIQLDILEADHLFQVEGNVTYHEPKAYLDTSKPLHPDSINRSDLNFKASSITFDLNPHHVSHILNLVSNYADGGKHTISTGERHRLSSYRRNVGKKLIEERRHPTDVECLLIGIGTVPKPGSLESLSAVDAVFCFNLEIESGLARVHELPHALAPFKRHAQNSCSVDLGHVSANMLANRLGSDLHISTIGNLITVYGGWLEAAGRNVTDFKYLSPGKMKPPIVTIDSLNIRKDSKSSIDYGQYTSNLSVEIGNVSGCVLDVMVVSLTRIIIDAFPESEMEDHLDALDLLFLDKTDLTVSSANLLLLSSASDSSAESSRQRNSHSSLNTETACLRGATEASVPALLTGVSQVVLPNGMRLCSSNYMTETTLSRTRIFLPDISVDVFMSWGGTLTPWVDEATVRTQLSHASNILSSHHHNLLQGRSLFRKVLELHDLNLDIFMNSRPAVWTDDIHHLQQVHVTSRSHTETNDFPYCFFSAKSPLQHRGGESKRSDLWMSWWDFLKFGTRTALVRNCLEMNMADSGIVESLSIAVVSDVFLFIAPECLEVANDIVLRCHEKLLNRDAVAVRGGLRNTSDQSRTQISPSDLVDAWRTFESSKQSIQLASVAEGNAGILDMIGFETKAVHIVLLCPILIGERTGRVSFPSLDGGMDEVHLSMPQGLHTLLVERIRSVESTEPSQIRAAFHSMEHRSTLRTSLSSIVAKCNGKELGSISDVTVVIGKCMKYHHVYFKLTEPRYKPQEEELSMTGKISSIVTGKDEKGLDAYSAFGRTACIFILLFRAFGLEVSSLSESRSSRETLLCREVFKLSVEEMKSRPTDEIRSAFCDLAKKMKENAVIFNNKKYSNVLSESDDTHANVRTDSHWQDKSQIHITSSIDLSLQQFSIGIAGEELIVLDAIACRGGSNFGEPDTSIVDGHVLNASVGSINLSIGDSIAAETLRMVSEVALFVKTATFSMPMLRHEANKAPIDADTPIQPHRLSLNPSEVSRVKPISHFLPNIHFPHHTRRRTPSSSLQQSSFFKLRSHQHMPLKQILGPDSSRFQKIRRGVSLPLGHIPPIGAIWHRKDHRGSAGSTSRPQSLEERGQSSKRRSRDMEPQVFPPVDRMLQSNPSYHIGLFDHSRNMYTRENVLDEDDDRNYRYTAIRTAGEVGPPRKKSKSRVRIVPVIPPAFANVHNQVQSTIQEENQTEAKLGSAGSPSTLTSKHSDRLGKPRVQIRQRSSAENSEPRKERVDVQSSRVKPEKSMRKRAAITLFVSCGEIVSHYYRQPDIDPDGTRGKSRADIRFSVHSPRLSFMTSPNDGSQSLIMTASSALLESMSNPHCLLKGSIASMRMTMSLAQGVTPSILPKMITSAQVSGFKVTLYATDLQSVLKFREEFKHDLKAILLASVTTKVSISEMAEATRLSSHTPQSEQSHFSTIAFDLSCEKSLIKLEGFHPQEKQMCISYFLDGMFFSIAASEKDKAALTLGLRLYGHGLSITTPLWASDETFHFPNLDAKGVQWAETTGLPTVLKVSAEPLVNSTSIQGLRHVLFTVSGLLAFQSASVPVTQDDDHISTTQIGETLSGSRGFSLPPSVHPTPTGTTPFTRSFAAWERTKGVRMDISIRPMSISLASGQVVALFNLGAITGSFEWNKLVTSGVQLHSTVNIPRVSLMYMRMPSTEFSFSDIQPDERRASLSVGLEGSRIDLLKTQEDLTHTFTFRIDVFSVWGQVRPWRLMLDAAVWADEQEFVSDLQAINYRAMAASRQRQAKSPSPLETGPSEHRVILIGSKIQGFVLAVPLLNSEEYSSSRLSLTATELRILMRQRFDNISKPQRNVIDIKSRFVGILWDKSALLSTHHSRITIGVGQPSANSSAMFGAMKIVMVAGTWHICPRKDVLMAVLEAKNSRENRDIAEKTREIFGALPEVLSRAENSATGDSASYDPDQGRLIVESLEFKMLRTSGFIEGLESDMTLSHDTSTDDNNARRRRESSSNSKFSVPAFSVAIVRTPTEDFDVVDIDFSGRDGEFPKDCLRKTANIFSELFGAASLIQEDPNSAILQSKTLQQHRVVSRDLSILVRFGKSLYQAEEEVTPNLDSKFSFFAERSSALLASLSTEPIIEEDTSHTTVITGVSPKLTLEITPLMSGTKTQSLRLVEARFIHSLGPSFPPLTLIHIKRVTALVEAKTLLLTQGRLTSVMSEQDKTIELKVPTKAVPSKKAKEGNLTVILGKPRRYSAEKDPANVERSQENRVDPDLRLQLKLTSGPDTPPNQVDFFVERLHMGLVQSRKRSPGLELTFRLHFSFHEVFLRGQWDHLNCKLRLKENLWCCTASDVSMEEKRLVLVSNILNRLQFEILQYEKHTLKLDVDALAAIWAVPKRDVLIESTTMRAEVSHTMKKALVKLAGQMKKLQNEVKLLLEKESIKESPRVNTHGAESLGNPSVEDAPTDLTEAQNQLSLVPSDSSVKTLSGLLSTHSVTALSSQKKDRKRTKIFIKGDEASVTMRGYQFEESQLSATILCTQYAVSYDHSIEQAQVSRSQQKLDIDFVSMSISYNDDERGIHSDLFSVPNPRFRLGILDRADALNVDLQGDLLVKLGQGFFYWQEFKTLAELTIRGIAPPQDGADQDDESVSSQIGAAWEGREPRVNVELNPRVDVIGDLTQDMWQIWQRRLGRSDVIPRQLYEFVIIPLEALSDALCDPLK